MDKVDYYEIYANIDIDILTTQALFVMKFLPYTLKITQITIMFKIFSNPIQIRKNLPPNLNQGFIEPPYRDIFFWINGKDALS